MKKIACYNCSESIEIKEADAFSKIECPSCSAKIEIPKIVGDFILSKKISGNKYYETYKGLQAGSDNTIVLKLIIDLKFNDEAFSKMEEKLSPVSTNGELTLKKLDGHYIAYRPFYETSIEDYLKNSRPKSEKAIYILDQIAEKLDEYIEKNTYPVNLTIGNLLMDKEGQLIISDLLFRESLYEVLGPESKETLLNLHCTSLSYLSGNDKRKQDTLFAFGCLSYLICCGIKPWPPGKLDIIKKARNIQPGILLNLREGNPDNLKLIIKKLIDEKSDDVQSFKKVKNLLGLNPSKIENKVNKTTPKKKALKPSNKAARPKSKRKAKTANPIPIIIGLAALLALVGVFALVKGKDSKQTVAKVEEQESKKDKKKVVKKPAKKIQIKAEPKIITQIVKENKTPEVIKEVKKPLPKKIDREAIKAELMPPDFNFDPIVEKLDEYIAATKKEDRDIEEDKIEIVSMFRDHLLIHFYRHPYTGVFHLQNKGLIRAKIIKADENDIQLMNVITKKPLVISWKDFEFIQFKEFADYYAASYTDAFSLSENSDEIFKKVSKEYVTLAVVLDWYGFKEEAIEYKKKAIKFDASQVAKLDLMIKEDQTN